MIKLTYRPEINGLRAIAVWVVVLYHAQINIFGISPFKGGLIGVDIFFVISGYLITSIIFKELFETGAISIKNFYERRIRRILPALFFVMLVSTPFAWIYLIPSSLVDYSNSLIFTLGFSSNYYFHYSGLAYGAVSGFFKPFLHTWSLSVEEQFYIIFPVFLLITFKYYKRYLIHVIFFGFLISLGLAEWSSTKYSSVSFYFIHTRMWELLMGSMLAYFEITLGHRSKNKILNLILPTVGIILIGYFILFYDTSIKHPSLHTLLPVVGASLIIWFSNKNEIITRILSSKLFVGFGLISYSLYLWHYPIFSFLKINGIVSNNILGKLFLIPIIIFLSIFSYYFVERPFRNMNLSFKKVIFLLGVMFFSLLIINMKIIKEEGFNERFKNLKKINENYNPDNFFLGQSKMKYSISNFNEFNNKNYNIIIIGDSHGGDLFNALYLNSNLFDNISFYYVNNIFKYGYQNYENFIKNSDKVILSYKWNNDNYNLLKKNFKQIADLNKNIMITSSSNEYETPSKLYTLLDYKVLFEKQNFDYFGLKKLYYKKRVIHSLSDINIKLKNFTLKQNIKYLNHEDYMCEISKKECDYVDKNGYKLFYDYGHYTEHGARYFGEKIHNINWLELE
jgi:peptidoglycan/LPS O-acetylase OafA/YrhL